MINVSHHKLLPAEILNPNKKPLASVIWLHGLGANGHDFVPVVPELRIPKTLPVRFVFPHAPMRSVTINNGMKMPAWYDIQQLDFSAAEDTKGIHESAQAICDLIEQEQKLGTAYQHIFLAGFSQGGAIALQTGLRYPETLGGLIVLSSYLPLAHTLTNEMHQSNQKISIFMAHGKEDDLIPLALAEKSRNILQSQGCSIEWHSYQSLQHSVCIEEIRDIGLWITSCLTKNA